LYHIHHSGNVRIERNGRENSAHVKFYVKSVAVQIVSVAKQRRRGCVCAIRVGNKLLGVVGDLHDTGCGVEGAGGNGVAVSDMVADGAHGDGPVEDRQRRACGGCECVVFGKRCECE